MTTYYNKICDVVKLAVCLYGHFVVSVIHEITEALGIHCFRWGSVSRLMCIFLRDHLRSVGANYPRYGLEHLKMMQLCAFLYWVPPTLGRFKSIWISHEGYPGCWLILLMKRVMASWIRWWTNYESNWYFEAYVVMLRVFSTWSYHPSIPVTWTRVICGWNLMRLSVVNVYFLWLQDR